MILLYFIAFKWTKTLNGRTIICFYGISAMAINWSDGKITPRISDRAGEKKIHEEKAEEPA